MMSHLYIYNNNKDINGIVHTHSTFATAFCANQRSIPCYLTAQADEFGGEIPCAKYSAIGGSEIGEAVIQTLKKTKSKRFNKYRIPKFNKAIDDRLKKKSWYLVKKVPDVIIFEGWCVGARAEKQTTLKKSINSLERKEDKNLKWRKFVNYQLEKKYKKLFSKLDCLLFLKAGNFKLLQTWRLKQEALLKLNSKNKANNKVMDKNEVLKFMQTYQRVTQNMFKFAPKYSSIVLNLNRNHQIKSIKYNK